MENKCIEKHAIELEFARDNAKKYTVIEHKTIQLDSQLFSSSALVDSHKQLSAYKDGEKPEGEENAYVSYRNLVFLSMAVSLAESHKINDIYVAFNKDDCVNFWDCTSAFLSQLNTISEHSKTEVHAPLINLTKKEVVQLAKKLDVDLNRTISCYQPSNDMECGVCLSCLVKREAFVKIKAELKK
ncbi:7-cyano-7-deazaguanine synthase [Olleya sp. Bg11-27]|uniref:7-cyano-7-deazaguanine synthase n=1 Tax=Olleya sp. Bg11-27 TaxID=2058135 RepID=UPI0012FD5F07|nr:7-cyano-7-deazaguanine synthase [Olleya sp. Bg11-27]